MKVSYYPGCSLEGTAKSDYAESLHAIAKAFDIQLDEVKDWHCCGASAAHSINHHASIELAGNIVSLTSKLPHDDLLVPCPMCFNRLKTAAKTLKEEHADKYRVQLGDEVPNIWGFAEYFATPGMLDAIGQQVVKPLKDLKVVCYYGCMSNRPPEVTGAEDHENPQIMERILDKLGATVIDWPYKTDCCGASLVLSKPGIVHVLVGKLYDMARRVGADAVVVSCQMCQMNLDMYQAQIEATWEKQFNLPIYYFSELIGLACGLKGAENWISKHITESLSLLNRLGLLKNNVTPQIEAVA
jgi:heterodisulfide reductase subunit B2